jgi:hypothetical protein
VSWDGHNLLGPDQLSVIKRLIETRPSAILAELARQAIFDE